jgi:hypothetical protein
VRLKNIEGKARPREPEHSTKIKEFYQTLHDIDQTIRAYSHSPITSVMALNFQRIKDTVSRDLLTRVLVSRSSVSPGYLDYFLDFSLEAQEMLRELGIAGSQPLEEIGLPLEEVIKSILQGQLRIRYRSEQNSVISLPDAVSKLIPSRAPQNPTALNHEPQTFVMSWISHPDIASKLSSKALHQLQRFARGETVNQTNLSQALSELEYYILMGTVSEHPRADENGKSDERDNKKREEFSTPRSFHLITTTSLH